MTRQDIINNILIEEDIEGLIEIGAPTDEYISEAELISEAIGSDQIFDIESVYNILQDVWESSFNLDEEGIFLRRNNLLRASERIAVAVQERER